MGTRGLAQDFRYAIRAARRSPGFAAVAILTLALGIGANTAIFSIVRGVLLRPLPYRDASRLLVGGVSLPDFEDLRRSADAFDGTAVFVSNLYDVGVGSEIEQLRGALVSADFFSLLGTAPAAGRTLGPADAMQPVAVVSDGLARRRAASPAAALGGTVLLSGRAFTIVGVMPPAFEFPGRSFDLWLPLENELARTPDQSRNRALRIFRAVARVRPGVSIEAARGQVRAVSRRLQAEHPDTNTGYDIDLLPLSERIVGAVRGILWTLLAAVGLVLLIATANLANLMLARGAARSREIAIRAALGAGRGRLVRQFLTESLLLSIAGGAVGVLLAAWALSALPLVAPQSLPRLADIRWDPAVLLFTLSVSVASGLLFGTAPALSASRVAPARGLALSVRGSAARPGLLRGTLVVTEVALAVVVLVGAGLLARSLQRLLSVDKGFDERRLTSFSVNLSELESTEARASAAAGIVRGLEAIAGVQSAGAGTALPPETAQRGTRFEIEGRPFAEGEDSSAYFVAATPGYFETLRTRVADGRTFRETDRAGSAPVAMISRGLATRLFPGGSAVGRRLRLVYPDQSDAWREIVGVVDNVRYSGLDDPGAAAVYTPFAQTPFLWAYGMVRSDLPASTLAPSIRAAVRGAHPALSAARIRPAETLVSEAAAGPRFEAALLSAFAALALLLAALGLFGLISYGASLRRREMGIRIALGAPPREIFALVAGGGLRLVVLGLAVGIAASLAATRLIASLLFEVRPTDPPTYAAMAAVFLAVGLVAGAIPARRAARIDPLEALRSE
jgi:putative ABC transport system permease protein